MHDDPSVLSLLTRAQAGDQQAWDTLVDWYAPLVWSICRRYRLADADAGDVGRTVWLRLADQLDTIGDPATLPSWLATATARESAQALPGGPGTARRRADATGHEHSRRDGRDSRARARARTPAGRAPHRVARGPRPSSAGLPAAAHAPPRRPPGSRRQDQRRTGHPHRPHRTRPQPLPGHAARPPRHRSPDQRRTRERRTGTARAQQPCHDTPPATATSSCLSHPRTGTQQSCRRYRPGTPPGA